MIRSRAWAIVAFACFIKVSASQCALGTSTTNQQPLLNTDNINIAALSNLVKNVISLTTNNGINANYRIDQQQPCQATTSNLLLQPIVTSSNLDLTPAVTQNIVQAPSAFPLQHSNTFVLPRPTAPPVINTLSASFPQSVSTFCTENPVVSIQQSTAVPEYNEVYNEEPLVVYLNVESEETPLLTQNFNSESPIIEVAVMSEEYLSSLFSPAPPQSPLVYVKDRKSSSLNKILPLLLLSLKDKSPSYPYPSCCPSSSNNCCNNDCGCSTCNYANAPIIYPVPIPINSPFPLCDVKV